MSLSKVNPIALSFATSCSAASGSARPDSAVPDLVTLRSVFLILEPVIIPVVTYTKAHL